MPHTSLILGGVLALTLGGCANKPANYQALASTTDPAGEISNLKSALDQANEVNTKNLAPSNFSKAEKEYESALKARASNKDNDTVLDHISRSRAYLQNAISKAEQARGTFTPVMKAREAALAVGAQESQKEKLAQADKKLREASDDLEAGKLKVSSEKLTKLEKPFREAELSAIENNYLGIARRQLDTAKKEGAEKTSPQVWSAAMTKYQAAEDAIRKDRYAEATNKPLADAANAEAALVLKITRDAKIASKKSPEEIALAAHRAQNKIQDLNQDQSRLKSLESEKAIDDKVASVRAKFSTSEADVFRDGNRVLIRLKNVQFPVNQAAIRPAQLPALTKVQDAVKMFGESKVVVEGHTDSQGGAKLNQTLSEKRAELVESYLVSNGAVTEGNIEAIGYGYQKPITSNKTASGRAQNRRIDVVIKL